MVANLKCTEMDECLLFNGVQNAVARVAGDTMTLTEKVAKSVAVHRIPCVLIVMPTVQSSSIDFRTEQLFR
jgi:hypothetical protein